MGEFQPVLVDTDTARRMLGNIGKTKLFELFNEGKLERRKLGAKTLVPVSSIRAFAESLEAA
ncbi:hypothetical protein JHL17_34050 [Azospirillum sp. YIM B02556]|uniref:Helix-turn-helix domain-containing protein n=1 Tax=Azospirillum endophyticum TaxID=2800326 RepID=A0ABS1FG85_9PROT|nr:hypothetical protein [Azospirillum endophyticum]MBK1842430.1 hypothetical protein [Azospirillum endophyticum]